jgi:hypothetical protein
MAPPRASHTGTGSANQDFLATLGRVYGSGRIRRDVLGRRIALPSEIARALAQDALFPARLIDKPGHSTLPATAFPSNPGED